MCLHNTHELNTFKFIPEMVKKFELKVINRTKKIELSSVTLIIHGRLLHLLYYSHFSPFNYPLTEASLICDLYVFITYALH